MAFIFLFFWFSKEKIILLAIVWILIGVAPACLVAFRNPYVGALIEPHWFIFSTIGFCIIAAYFCLSVFNRMKVAGILLLVVIVFSWGAASRAYNELWADQKTYALYWSQQVPNLKSTYFYVADADQKQGLWNESRKYYQLALSGDPSDIEIYNNLGLIDAAQGHFKAARSNYNMALRINPYSAGTYNNLGLIDYTEGKFDKAAEHLNRALAYNPLLIQARRELALIAVIHAEYRKAIDLCLKNLDIVPDDPNTLLILINIYIHQKDIDSLKNYAYRMINTQSDPAVLTKLGDLMVLNNIIDIAKDSYTKALRVDPGFKDAYLGVGTLLERTGNHNKAIQIWKLGLSLDPTDRYFKTNIAKAMGLKLKS